MAVGSFKYVRIWVLKFSSFLKRYVQPGATFYVSFQVIRGGDGMAGFAVKNQQNEIVHPYQWQARY